MKKIYFIIVCLFAFSNVYGQDVIIINVYGEKKSPLQEMVEEHRKAVDYYLNLPEKERRIYDANFSYQNTIERELKKSKPYLEKTALEDSITRTHIKMKECKSNLWKIIRNSSIQFKNHDCFLVDDMQDDKFTRERMSYLKDKFGEDAATAYHNYYLFARDLKELETKLSKIDDSEFKEIKHNYWISVMKKYKVPKEDFERYLNKY